MLEIKGEYLVDNLNELTPAEYFQLLKSKKNKITDEELRKIYDNCLILLNKYKITGQVRGMKKLLFHLETIEKEIEIVRLGVDTFIYKDDIEEYIDNVADDVVKIIELENYEREIPDEIVEVIEKTKDKFDQLYVLFTDYTGKVERRVAKERRSNDPILFGTFQDKSINSIIDRFYFLGDWQDEYCDLTLDKMVNEMKEKRNKDIVIHISTPKDLAELKAQLNSIETGPKGEMILTNNKKQSLFKKIRTIFTKKKPL